MTFYGKEIIIHLLSHPELHEIYNKNTCVAKLFFGTVWVDIRNIHVRYSHNGPIQFNCH